MIRTVRIENIRGIRQGAVERLSPISVLVGRNGCGKSTVLDALAIVSAENPGAAAIEAIGRRGGDDPQLSPDWLLNKVATGGSVYIASEGGAAHKLDVVRVQGGQLELREGAAAHGAPPIAQITGRGSGTWSSRRFPVQPISVRFIDLRAVSPLRLPPDELYSEARTAGRKGPVLEMLRHLVPDALEDIEILKIQGKPTLCLSYKNTAVPLSLSGDGIRNVTMLAFELGVPSRSLVLVEEPETHLHPAAMTKAAEAMIFAARGESQVVLATHSLEFIDCLVAAATGHKAIDLLSVHRLALLDGQLSVSSFTGEMVSAARLEAEQELR